MKIIIGSESFAPNISGVATVTELLATNLAKDGNEVWVFAPSENYKTYKDKSFKDFAVWRFNSFPNPFRKDFRFAAFSQQEIFRFTREIQPDLIHLQDPVGISSQLSRAARRQKIPVVISNHFSLDYVTSYFRWLKPFHPEIRIFMRAYLKRFYNRCNYIICPTETVKKELVAWGVNRPISAVSNGIDLDRFFEYFDLSEFFDKYHLPPNKKVLYVGRLDKDKNVDVLIDCIPGVLQKTNAHFVIVGDGSELDKFKKTVEKMGIGHAVSFLGWIDNKSEDYLQVFESASVFVITSKIETQSIVTMEAMAAGLPVIGADAGALPELIKSNCNGHLFCPDNSEDLAKKINKVLSDSKLQKKMSAESLRLITSHEIKKSFYKINEIYDKVIKKN